MVEYESKNWLRVIFRLQGSVLPSLLPRILLATAVGVLARWLYTSRHFHLPSTVHGMLGLALGLLLVFRTNASYDRWWEGRRLLGAIVNRARDLMRQGGVYFDDVAARRELERLVVLWYALLRQYLRGERDLAALGVPLRDDERAALEPMAVRPALIVRQMTALIAAQATRGSLSEQRLWLMDANITSLVDSWGGCERIVRTPIPFAYAQHIKAFLTLFVLTVPFAIVDAMGPLTPLAAAIVAYGLFGIEEIGVEIEDPFGTDPNDLPLERIGTVIANDARTLAGSPAEAA